MSACDRPPDDAPDLAVVAKHYDELDDAYRQVWSDHAHHGWWRTGRESIQEAVIALVDLAGDAARVEAKTRLVDVGSGYGATGRHLSRTRGASVTSFTISPRQYEYARTVDAGDPRLHHELRDWLDNGLPDASFDAVIAIESIAHMPPERALVECARVLRRGGRLAILDLVAGDAVPKWQVNPLLRRMEEESHLTPRPTLDAFVDQVRAAGFEIDEVRDLTSGVRGTWPRAVGQVARNLPRNPALRRFVFSDEYENDGFLRSILRMTVALRTGAVRYCLVSAVRT